MYKIIKTNKSWIESRAEEQIKSFSEKEGIELVVGYPDLHPGKMPVGVSYISKGIIYPYVIGNDIGCSMNLYRTSCQVKKFKCDKVVKKLQTLIDTDSQERYEYNKGTIGGGNHFGEFTTIKKVYNAEALDELSLDKNKVLLLVHSGSRGLGEQILRKYIEQYSCQNGLKIGSEGFEKYMEDYNKAIEFSKESRDIIADTLCEATNIKNEGLVLESVHNGLEEINGHFVHRKGASPANCNYVVIAGSRGTSSYIVKPLKNTFEFGYSLAHGAGRKWQRGNCKEKLQGKYLRKDIKKSNIGGNIVYKQKELIYEEAPEAYKSIERVIEDMLEFEMIELIAELTPLVTYKA